MTDAEADAKHQVALEVATELMEYFLKRGTAVPAALSGMACAAALLVVDEAREGNAHAAEGFLGLFQAMVQFADLISDETTVIDDRKKVRS